MANGQINLQISTTRTGNGLESTLNGVGKLDAEISANKQAISAWGKVLTTVGGDLGNLGGKIGGVASLLGKLKLGWIGLGLAAAEGIKHLVDAVKNYKKLADDAALAAKGLSKEYMSMEAAQRGYSKRVEEYRKKKDAQERANKAAADEAKKNAEAEGKARAEQIEFGKQVLTLDQQINKARRERDAIGKSELEKAEAEAETIREQAALAVQLAQIEKENVRAKIQRGEVGDGVKALTKADKEFQLALARQEKAEAEAAQRIADAKERIAREEAEKEKKIAEEARQAETKARMAQLREEEKARRAQAAQVQADLKKQIEAAQAEAAKLEENAQRARGGKTFGEWARGERDIANEHRKADRRQANVIRNAEDQIRRLESERRRFGRGFSPQRAATLAKLREFVADQDPNNNPALKKARELEEKRRKAEEQAQRDIAAIKKALEAGIGL